MLWRNNFSNINGSNSQDLERDFLEDRSHIEKIHHNLDRQPKRPKSRYGRREVSKKSEKKSLRDIKNNRFVFKEKVFKTKDTREDLGVLGRLGSEESDLLSSSEEEYQKRRKREDRKGKQNKARDRDMNANRSQVSNVSGYKKKDKSDHSDIIILLYQYHI